MNPTLQYELSRADLEAFFVHHAAHAPYLVARNRRFRWIWGALFAVLALVYASRSLVAGATWLALAIFFVAFYGRLNRWWYVRHNLRLDAGADGPRLGATRLELANGELLVDAPEGSSRLALSVLRRIEASNSHYFVYLGPVSALILPRAGDVTESFVAALRSARGAV